VIIFKTQILTMKQLMIVLLFAPVLGWGQTVEIEAAYLNKQIADNKWTQEEALARGKMWTQIKGKYPLLDYDTVHEKLVIEDVIEFPGITKNQAFKRVKEWGALHFGKLDAVLEYEDLEYGKIILEGFQEVTHLTKLPGLWGRIKTEPTTSKLYFSLVVTIKEGKAKVQYENLEFRYWRYGYALGSVWVPGELERTGFGYYMPVTSRPPEHWVVTIDLLRNSVDVLKRTAPSLEKYIGGAVDDYRF